MTDTRREEIAMAIGFASRHKFDASKDAAEFWEYISGEGREWYLRMADAVLPIVTPAPVAGWRSMDSAPDWEGFGRALMEDWPTGDIDGSHLFDMSLKYGLITEVPGGYNPDEHIDAEGICPETGDPWYEYAFGTQPATEQQSVKEAARVLLEYLPNYAMENAALESRARDDEGEFASLSDLLDFSGQNKAYTVVREALTAALRSLAGDE